METLLKIVQTVNMYLSDYVLVILLIGAGLYFTIRTKFVQVRCFGEGWRRFFGEFSLNGEKHKAGMSSFQALATAVAAQVGTGNIVGACGAILIGGPGAIFWMWIIAFFGMATIYAEAVLAQETRVVESDGTVLGGPVYYIKRAFPNGFGKFLAGFFAVAITLALGFMGNMVQSNSIGAAFAEVFAARNINIPAIAIGLVLAVLTGFIFVGGTTRLAAVVEKIVPIMAGIYIIGSLVVILLNINSIPTAFMQIIVGAFKPNAVLGGAAGITVREAIRYGVARGLFSNEAGMGSTPHAHARATAASPHDQGLAAMISVFIDTFIILNLTVFSILTTGAMASGKSGTALTQYAFSSVLGSFGDIFIAVCLFFFAFSTILGWHFFGAINVKHLFGQKGTKIYSMLVVVFIIIGSTLKVDLVWSLADFFNGLMVIPNALALLALSGVVVGISKKAK
mgnify:CR=1 FL=1